MFLAGPLGGCLASVAASCACSACTCVSREILRKSARLAYCALFFLGMVTAWILRDFAKPLIEKIPWIMRPVIDIDPSDKWFGIQAVYRISMGQFLFFTVLSMALVGVRYKGDKRDKYLHHGHWLLKLALWLVFTALPFFFPNNVVMAYGWLARVGSGIFLVMQMVILLDFTQTWNDAWVAEGEADPRWLYALLGVTVAAFASCLGISGALFYWFNPAAAAGGCSLNVTLITLTLLLTVALALAALHPAAHNGSLFPSAAIALYTTYLCYSALQSEPRAYECNGLAHRLTAASASTLVLGMLLTLASVIYSAFRAGSNTRLFSLSDSDADSPHAPVERPLLAAEEGHPLTSAGLDALPDHPPGAVTADSSAGPRARASSSLPDDYSPVTYNYSFFHMVFALASMYIAMLMTGWGTGEGAKDLIDVGWASVWVKVSAQWVAAGLYCWSLYAPALFPDRDFS